MIQREINKIKYMAEEIIDIPFGSIDSKKRHRNIALARQVVGAFMVCELGIDIAKAGELMNRDRTSFYFYKRKLNSKIIKSMNENKNKSSKFFGELMEFYTIFHKELYETEETPLHDPCVIAYLLDPSIFSGKEVNVTVEENSELTRGETVVDWLGVTKRPVNCFVMNEANDEKFFQLLKAKLSLLP